MHQETYNGHLITAVIFEAAGGYKWSYEIDGRQVRECPDKPSANQWDMLREGIEAAKHEIDNLTAVTLWSVSRVAYKSYAVTVETFKSGPGYRWSYQIDGGPARESTTSPLGNEEWTLRQGIEEAKREIDRLPGKTIQAPGRTIPAIGAELRL